MSKQAKPVLVQITSERRMLPDGTLIYTPIHVREAGLMVNTREAAELTRQSIRQIQHLCDIGYYTTAVKQTSRSKSHWMIERREVLARRAADPS